jgi:hypothetical protein
MTAHPNRCRMCIFAPGDTGNHWCYACPPANGGNRQWIDENTYNDFIALLGCASFKPSRPLQQSDFDCYQIAQYGNSAKGD